MKPNRMPSRSFAAGFSLVEIMVGLVIGLLATLVIMQVFSVFEGQKRTTTGVADAQTNGSIALYSAGRDLQMAGYGLLPLGSIGVADSPLECTTLDIHASTGYAAASGIEAISPVIINEGNNAGAGTSPGNPGVNNTDSITIHYSSSNTGGIPYPAAFTGNPNEVRIDNDFGCQAGDIALLYSGSACALSKVNSISSVPPILTMSYLPGPVTGAGAGIACHQKWNQITYQVSDGNLVRTENGVNVPIIAGIVNIQAQYGVSNLSSSNIVTDWVNASGPTWGSPTTANRNRIKAIRIAIVARNGLLEKDDVTFLCNSITADDPFGLCAWSGTSTGSNADAPWIYLSYDADGISWQRYRYRVFETIIPLRNMIWSKNTL